MGDSTLTKKIDKFSKQFIFDSHRGTITSSEEPNKRFTLLWNGSDGKQIAPISVSLVNEDCREDEVYIDINSLGGMDREEPFFASLIEQGIIHKGLTGFGIGSNGQLLYPKFRINLD